MQTHGRFTFLHFLVVLGLVTAGISPACQFVSGKTDFIEICSSFGVKTIAVPASGQNPEQHKTKKPCPFCCAAQTHKSLFAGEVLFVLNGEDSVTFPLLAEGLFEDHYSRSYEARAPPRFS